jgi:hypothetical protein
VRGLSTAMLAELRSHAQRCKAAEQRLGVTLFLLRDLAPVPAFTLTHEGEGEIRAALVAKAAKKA